MTDQEFDRLMTGFEMMQQEIKQLSVLVMELSKQNAIFAQCIETMNASIRARI